MISDDRPGPSPMPDQMGRTPFGESVPRQHTPRALAAGPDRAGVAGFEFQ